MQKITWYPKRLSEGKGQYGTKYARGVGYGNGSGEASCSGTARGIENGHGLRNRNIKYYKVRSTNYDCKKRRNKNRR
jgi:hypothetical protein